MYRFAAEAGCRLGKRCTGRDRDSDPLTGSKRAGRAAHGILEVFDGRRSVWLVSTAADLWSRPRATAA